MSDYFEDPPASRDPEQALREADRERARHRRVVAMVVWIAVAILVGVPLVVAYIAALFRLFDVVAS